MRQEWHWLVYSPEIELYASDGIDPPECGCCVVTIPATSKRKAIQEAIKSPQMRKWVESQRDDDLNPFSGLKAEKQLCPHGICFCDLCPSSSIECEKCPECAEELKEIWEKNL